MSRREKAIWIAFFFPLDFDKFVYDLEYRKGQIKTINNLMHLFAIFYHPFFLANQYQ